MVKAYLRQSDELKLTNARWFRKPLQMNLELTTKCPLRCPQCYVHLNTGEELPLEEALYWMNKRVEDRAKRGVLGQNKE